MPSAGTGIMMAPLSVRSFNFYQRKPAAQQFIPYTVKAREKMADLPTNYTTNSYNTNSFNNSTNSFNPISHHVNIGVEDEKSEILAWLFPLEPRIRHQGLRTRRADNVGEWLLRTDEFQRWCNEGEHATLFCYGDPAVGKTFFR